MNSYITEVDALDEAKECFLVYAEEVLTDRAIPSAEDGLLSAQRKILWTMEDYLKMNNKGKTKKCNAIVGSTLATSYFHGDASCYGVLCKMSQEYLMRYPLIQGQGSLGTQEDNSLKASSRYCVAGDTYISTENGMKKIEDIVPNSESDSEYDINLVVQGGFGEKRKATKFFNTGIRDIYKIQLQNGMWIKVTPNHPILTLDKNLNFCWKLAENLKEDDKILISYNTNNACFGNNNDLLEAKMLGCMVSEGYATTQNRIGINNKDTEMIKPVYEFMNSKIENNSASIYYNEKRKYYEYCIANKNFYADFVKRYEFEKSDKKHLPKSFFEGTKEYQSLCLSYLFEGDGSVDPEHGISYSSISEELIHQLQTVLIQNFGILSSVRRMSTRNEIKLCINNVSAPLFQKEINFISERKKNNLQQLVNDFNSKKNISNINICAIHEVTNYVREHHIPGTSSRAHSLSFNNPKTFWKAKDFVSEEDYSKLKNIIDNYYYLKITSIEKTESEIAYSIRIDDDTHSFIGNGFTNHNTEAKPSKYADLMMLDYKKHPVPEKETYNGEFYEPVVLPSLFPNALCNGRQAIGVSIAHASCPHNLSEVCDAIIEYIKDPNVDITKYILGPDFPLGGTIINKKDIRTALLTGKSSISLKVRGDYIVDKDKITFTTIPYRTYRNKIKEQLEKNVAEFEKVMVDFNDESNIGENKLVFFAKPNQAKMLLDMLFKYTDLQTTVSYNMNFIVNGTPKLCSVKDLIKAYVEHQNRVLLNVTNYDFDKAAKKKHIIEGLLIAIQDIDKAISLIKNAENKNVAREKLIASFKIDEVQADAVLDMKLSRLTKLDKDELLNQLKSLKELIEEYQKILHDSTYRNEVIIKKVSDMKAKYGDARRTKLEQIETTPESKATQPEITPEKCVVVMTEGGTIKRIAQSSFRNQKRNGKGVKTQTDITSSVIRTNTVDSLMLFTNLGNMYRLTVNDIPNGTNASKGTPISSLVQMEPNEKVSVMYSIYKDTEAEYIFFVTKKGTVKKTALKEYINTKKKNGIQAIKLREGDEIAAAFLIKDEDVFLLSSSGMGILFNSKEVGATGRSTIGIKGMKIKEDEKIISAIPIHDKSDNLAIICNNGLGKKIQMKDVTPQSKGGKGISYSKEPNVVEVMMVADEDNILLVGDSKSLCISAKDIPTVGRMALGNALIKTNILKSATKI